MDGSPVTRAEMIDLLGSLRGEIGIELAAHKHEITAELATQKREILDRAEEVMRDAKTEILKAFLHFQETTSIRIRAVEAKLSNTDTGLSERMLVIERRLIEIEKRLLLDPPAA